MGKILFFTSFIALIVTLAQGCTQSNAGSNELQVNQEPVVQSQNSSNNQKSVFQSQNNRDFEEPEFEEPDFEEPIVQSQNSRNQNSSVVQSQNNRDMNISRSTSKSVQHSSSSSGYTSQRSSNSSGSQSSTLSLSRANLNQPHILSITTSGKRLTGKVVINDKVTKKLYGNKVEFDLSPHLSVGENTVEIDAGYAPASSNLEIEMNGPGSTVSQQTSGNGVVNSNINIMVK